jgi:hypothetical protein
VGGTAGLNPGSWAYESDICDLECRGGLDGDPGMLGCCSCSGALDNLSSMNQAIKVSIFAN